MICVYNDEKHRAPALHEAAKSRRLTLESANFPLEVPNGGVRKYVMVGVLALLATAVMLPLLSRRSDGFLPHWYCFLGNKSLILTHLLSDVTIGLSYTAISVVLAYIVHRTYRRIPFHWLFLAFGTFIIACGGTHFMEAITLFKPMYWASGYLKVITALASLATAIALPLVTPQILAGVDAAAQSDVRRQQLETANRDLERATQDLRELDRLRTGLFAQRAANVGSWEVIPDSRRVIWSEAVEVIHGLVPGSFGGNVDSWLATVHADDRERVGRRIEEAFSSGEMQADYRTMRPDGSSSWTAASGKVIFDERGRPKRMLGVSMDVDARKRTELELQKQARVLDLANDAIMVLDNEGHITFWNRGAEQLYGWERQEVLGRRSHDLLQTEFPVPLSEITAELQRTGEWRGELVHTARSGSEVTVASRWTYQLDDNGEPIGTFEINRDITAQKLADDALRRSEKLAATGRLAATIAHEINNPLEAITNLLYLAQTDPGMPNSTRDLLVAADGELQRVAQLTKQTLGFYRESARTEPIEIGELLDGVLSLYEGRMNSKAIRVERGFVPGKIGYQVPGDIRQVVANLVANAIDALPHRGELAVRASVARGAARGLRITVADNGQGVATEYRENIFEAFFTTKKDVGTGLGLWVANEIVRKYNGRIRLHTRVRSGASGTVFGIFLPIDAAERVSQPDAARSAAS